MFLLGIRRKMAFLRIFAVVFLVVAVMAVGDARAIDLLGDKLAIHGFASQGYLDSTGNNYLTASRNGTFQLNEFGLTLTSRLTDKFHLGAQFLSRDYGTVGNNEVRLDWALADYRFHDLLGVRIGKIKRPMGFYNEERDSDFLRPMVFLPQSIYDETRRDMLIACIGGGVYGNVPAGILGDFDYQFFRGWFDFPDDSTIARATRVSAQNVASRKNLGAVTDLDMDNKYVVGAQVIFNTSIDGLRGAVSWQRGHHELILNDGALPPGDLAIRGKYVYSLEYVNGPLTLAGEYAETDREQKLFGISTVDGRTQEWYVMGTWAFNEQLSLSLLYDVFYSDKHDRDGTYFTRQGKPDYMAWRKDFGAGVRFDINPSWTVKAEWHEVDGAALYLELYNSPLDTKRRWGYGVVKVSYNF